jgi:hypothetical protein
VLLNLSSKGTRQVKFNLKSAFPFVDLMTNKTNFPPRFVGDNSNKGKYVSDLIAYIEIEKIE